MTIIIRGVTRCPICKQVHRAGDDLIGFPAIAVDGKAPDGDLGDLNDAAVHRACLEERPDLIEVLLGHPVTGKIVRDSFPDLPTSEAR
jgi:hypothetical protein